MKITKKSTPEEVGRKMLTFANEYVTKMANANAASNVVSFGKDQADSMRVYYKDASDFCGIAKLIFEMDFKGAVDATYDIDTCPRDCIPQDIWDYVTHHSRI